MLSLRLTLPVAAAGLLLSFTTAHAAPADLQVADPGAGLARGGLIPDSAPIAYGDDIVYGEHCGPDARREVPIGSDEYRQIVFLNFDGARLTRGGSNSKRNETRLITRPTLDYPRMDWPNYPGGRDAAIKAVVNELKILYMGIAVEFVTKRPTSGDYTMSMIGGRGEGVVAGGAAVGVSPLDCKNNNRNDVNVIFGARVSNPKRLSLVIAHELGHSFGLEHVSDRKGVMYPQLNGATCCWVSASVVGGGRCRKQQDSKKVLIDNLGAGPGDEIAPLVWFVRPGAGAVLPPNFSFEVGAKDDLKLHHVMLYLDKGTPGEKKLRLTAGPYAAAFADVPDGEHTLRAEAYDWKPNISVAEVRVTVRAGCVGEASCGGGKAGLGASCTDAEACTSGVCAVKEGAGVCVASCKTAKDICPSGTTCRQTGGSWACTAGGGWTLVEPAEGGCNAAGGVAALPGIALLAGIAIFGLRRRRS